MPTFITEVQSTVRNMLDEFDPKRARARAEREWAARQSAVDRLAELTTRRPGVVAQHEALLVPLRKREEHLREEYEAVKGERLRADAAKARELWVIDGDRQQLENELLRTAAEAIEAAADSMYRRFEAERNSISQWQEFVDPDKLGWNGHVRTTVSNQDAIVRLMGTMRTARAEFNALKLSNPTDVGAAIAAILGPVNDAWLAIKAPILRPVA